MYDLELALVYTTEGEFFYFTSMLQIYKEVPHNDWYREMVQR